MARLPAASMGYGPGGAPIQMWGQPGYAPYSSGGYAPPVYQAIPGGPYGENASSFRASADDPGAKRDEEILAGYRARRERALADLKGAGEQEGKDIATRYKSEAAAAGQDMVSRGLTGSTIAPTVKAGIANQEVMAQARLQERLRGERIGLDTRLDKDTLDYMERSNRPGKTYRAEGSGQGGGSGWGAVDPWAASYGRGSFGRGTGWNVMGSGSGISGEMANAARAQGVNPNAMNFGWDPKKWQDPKNQDRFAGGYVGAGYTNPSFRF